MIKDKKLFGIFNILDVAIIIILMLMLVFVSSKIKTNRRTVTVSEKKETMVEFYVEDAPDFVKKHIKEGDIVKDALQNNILGKVTSVTYSDPIEWNSDSNGNSVAGRKAGYVSVKIQLSVNSPISPNGGITINSYTYYVNKSMEIRVGNVAFYAKLSDMQAKN